MDHGLRDDLFRFVGPAACLIALAGCSDDGVPAIGTDGETASGTGAESADQGTGTFTTTGTTDDMSTTGTSTTRGTTGPSDGSTSDDTTTSGDDGTTGTTGRSDSTGTTGDTTGTTGSGDSTGSTGTTGDTTGTTGSTGTTGDTTGTTGDTTGGLQPGQCWDNLDCQLDEFCDYPDDMCGAGLVGNCQVKPDFCILIFDPVCGCDQQTHSNQCMAHNAGVDIDYDGPC